jgi:hypothetical protein
VRKIPRIHLSNIQVRRRSFVIQTHPDLFAELFCPSLLRLSHDSQKGELLCLDLFLAHLVIHGGKEDLVSEGHVVVRP